MIRFLSEIQGKYTKLAKIVKISISFNRLVFPMKINWFSQPLTYVLTPVCQSLCSQGGHVSASVHAGIYTPWEQTPPQPDTPSWSRHPPWKQTPPRKADTPPEADISPSSACWEIRATSGHYASYWNAYLFWVAPFDLFSVTCKQHHSSALNPIFKWYKNCDVDVRVPVNKAQQFHRRRIPSTRGHSRPSHRHPQICCLWVKPMSELRGECHIDVKSKGFGIHFQFLFFTRNEIFKSNKKMGFMATNGDIHTY